MRPVAINLALAGGLGLTGWFAYRTTLRLGRALLRNEELERKLKKAKKRTRRAGRECSVSATAWSNRAALPDFELADLSGERLTLSQLRGWRVLLIFFDPRCPYSRELLPGLAALQAAVEADLPIPLLIASGGREQNERLMEQNGIRWPVVLQDEREVATLYGVYETPAGYLVDEQGSAVGSLIVGPEALLAVARGGTGAAPIALNSNPAGRAENGRLRTTHWPGADQTDGGGLAVGAPVPVIRLERLDGGELALADYRGRRLLLVFSEPGCAPCDRLLPELEQVHRRGAGPELLLVGRGDPETNRLQVAELGLTFPVTLQCGWEVSGQFGERAVPSGYLIDESGVLASPAAVGADAVLALAQPA